jgi:REP element-mobilizing transposase RayT
MKDAPQEIRTFFVTSVANGRRPLFKKEEMARLFLDVLQDYRGQGRYLLHEFVAMPDHFHLIITPARQTSLWKRQVNTSKADFPSVLRRNWRSGLWYGRTKASLIIGFAMQRTIGNIVNTFITIR